MLDQSTLRAGLRYEPGTGEFTRVRTTSSRAIAGARAGSKNGENYLQIMVAGKRYPASRLAWLWMTGSWPQCQIDHRNGNTLDNRWVNLRAATRSFNQQNLRGARRDNKSGLLGVRQDQYGGFRAEITLDGVRIYLGYFRSAETAHAAYLRAKRELHPGCTI